MILSILPALLFASLDQRGANDHAPLLASMSTDATMLSAEQEHWAVAKLIRVGPHRERELRTPDGDTGSALVFDVDVDVVDGWNVPKGPLHTFWSENGREDRRATVAAMREQRVLVRLAPVLDGRYQLVSGSDEKPDFYPTFNISEGERLISILLPYDAGALEPGSPKQKRWATLWRAGSCLTPSAYQGFGGYISAAPLPITPRSNGKARYDANGRFLDNDVQGLADVEWLSRLAKKNNPEFQMLVAEYLDRQDVAGAVQKKRDLVLLALRQPEAFPNGLFRVADDQDLGEGVPSSARPWLPVKATVDVASIPNNPWLVSDLLGLLGRFSSFVPERDQLLPLLTSSNAQVKSAAEVVFEKWHGKPPKGADPVAWHRARAKLSQEQLQTATASGG